MSRKLRPSRVREGDAGWQDLSRRAFLRRAGLAASLTALSQLRIAPPAAAAAAPTGALLSPHETEILTQITERMVASDDPGAPAVRDTGAIAAIDALLSQLDPALTADLPLALRLFDWGPILFDLTFSRFTHMGAAEQDASIRCWMTSRLALRRQAYEAFRNLAFIGYYSQDAVWAGIGYGGPLIAPPAAP